MISPNSGKSSMHNMSSSNLLISPGRGGFVQSQAISRQSSPLLNKGAEEKVVKKAKELLNEKIRGLSKQLNEKYQSVLDNERSQFMRKIKQIGIGVGSIRGLGAAEIERSEELMERSPHSRELMKREMQNYEKLWKSKANNVKRNVSQAIQQKLRDEWKMPQLIKEAKEDIRREK